MRAEKIPGTLAIAERLVAGERKFEAMLVERLGCTSEIANAMRCWMAANKLTKQDFCLGVISVKHGAYLDQDVLERIRDHVTA